MPANCCPQIIPFTRSCGGQCTRSSPVLGRSRPYFRQQKLETNCKTRRSQPSSSRNPMPFVWSWLHSTVIVLRERNDCRLSSLTGSQLRRNSRELFAFHHATRAQRPLRHLGVPKLIMDTLWRQVYTAATVAAATVLPDAAGSRSVSVGILGDGRAIMGWGSAGTITGNGKGSRELWGLCPSLTAHKRFNIVYRVQTVRWQLRAD